MRLSRFVEFGRKIICIGRNYAEHAKEMGYAAKTDKPVIFLKPASSYVTVGNPIKIPRDCTELHHEVELGVVIGRKGSDIPLQEAMDYVGGYAISLDMTARDWQAIAKQEGKPWALAKGFDTSCPVGPFVPKEQIQDPHALKIWCKVNGETRQNGSTSDMIFKIPYIVHYVSGFFTLEAGDLILTGTPKGAGSVKHGDEIEIGLDDINSAKFPIISKESK